MKKNSEVEVKKSLQLRSHQTVKDILETTEDLFGQSKGDLPTMRQLASKSGYSIGTFYRYFGTINNLFIYIFIDRFLQKNLEVTKATIEQLSPNSTIQEVMETFVNFLFEVLNKKSHTGKLYKVLTGILMKTSRKPEELNKAMDLLIPSILLFQQENETNTCKIMNEEECRLALRSLQAAIRSPFLEGDLIAGTDGHRQYACDIAIALFAKS